MDPLDELLARAQGGTAPSGGGDPLDELIARQEQKKATASITPKRPTPGLGEAMRWTLDKYGQGLKAVPRGIDDALLALEGGLARGVRVGANALSDLTGLERDTRLMDRIIARSERERMENARAVGELGTPGLVGYGAGRLVGEGATMMAGSGAIAATARIPRATTAAGALARNTLPFLPFDLAIGAGGALPDEERLKLDPAGEPHGRADILPNVYDSPMESAFKQAALGLGGNALFAAPGMLAARAGQRLARAEEEAMAMLAQAPAPEPIPGQKLLPPGRYEMPGPYRAQDPGDPLRGQEPGPVRVDERGRPIPPVRPGDLAGAPGGSDARTRVPLTAEEALAEARREAEIARANRGPSPRQPRTGRGAGSAIPIEGTPRDPLDELLVRAGAPAEEGAGSTLAEPSVLSQSGRLAQEEAQIGEQVEQALETAARANPERALGDPAFLANLRAQLTSHFRARAMGRPGGVAFQGQGVATALGGLVGGSIGDTPEERGRNAMTGLLAGLTGDMGLAMAVIARVPKVAFANPELLADIINAQLKASGGFTVDPRTGARVTEGFSVAKGNATKSLLTQQAREVSPEMIRDYLARHERIFAKRANVMLGGWGDPESGNLMIEPTDILRNRQSAVELGRARGEYGVGDLAAYARGEEGTIVVGEPAVKYPPAPRTKRTGRSTLDVAKELIRGVRQAPDKPASQLRRALRVGVRDALTAFKQFGHARDWYAQDIARAEDFFRQLQPELKDPQQMALFKTLVAVASNGNKPKQDLELALELWRKWHGGGSLSLDAGEFADPLLASGAARWRSMEPGLQRLQQMVAERGPEKTLAYLTSPQLSPTGRGKATYGAVRMFGPKIGSFYLNTVGLHDEVTVDVWATRTWRRWQGIVREGAERKTGRPVLLDKPSEPERRLIHTTFTKIAQKLARQTGGDVSPSEVQAVLWYWEKELFRKLGANDSGQASFADAAAEIFTGQRTYIRERPAAPGRVAGATGPEGPGARLAAGEPGAPGAAGGAGDRGATPRPAGGATLETPPELAGALAGGVVGSVSAPDDKKGQGFLTGMAAGAGLGYLGRRLTTGGHRVNQAGLADAQQVLKSMATEAKVPTVEPLLTRATKAYQETVDALYSLREFGRRVGKTQALSHEATRASGWERAAEAIIRKDLRQVLQRARHNEPQVLALALAERAIELADKMGRTQKGIDLTTARQVAAKLSAIPAVREAVDGLQSYYRQLLDMKLAAGLITPDEYQRIAASGERYVPFVRDFMENAKAGPAKGLAQRGNTIRKMTDEEALSLIRNPLEQAVYDTYATTRAAARQRVTNLVAAIHDADPALAAPFLRDVTGRTLHGQGARLVEVRVNGVNRTFDVTDEGLADAWASMAPRSMDFVGKLMNKAKTVLQQTVTHFPAFGVANAARDLAMTSIQYPTSGTRQAASMAVGAAAGAALSDEDKTLRGAMMGAGIGLAAGSLGPHLVRTLQALGDIAGIGNRAIYEEWMREGGSGFGWYAKSQQDASAMIESLRRTGLDPATIVSPKSWWNALETVNRAIEEAPRLARYKYLKGRGAGIPEAIAGSRDISLDFSRIGSGSTVRRAAQSVAFLNPKVQGWDKMARMFLGERTASGSFRFTKNQAQAWAMGVATITAPTLALWEINKDNPEYWNRPVTERNLFWLVPDGEGSFIRIPKPFEVGYIFASLPERFLDWAHQKGLVGDQPLVPARYDLGRAMSDMGSNVLGGSVPVGTAFLPAVEAAIGKGGYSFFTGRPIVDERLQRLMPEERYNDRTSTLALKLGEKLGVAPQKVDHIIRGHLGSMGGYANDRLTDLARSVGYDPRGQANPSFETPGMFGRFQARPETVPEPVLALTARARELEEIVNTVNARAGEGAGEALERLFAEHGPEIEEYYAIQPFVDSINELRDLQRTIERQTDIPPEERRQQLLELRRNIAELANAAYDPARRER